jgi:hypothetical protein
MVGNVMDLMIYVVKATAMRAFVDQVGVVNIRDHLVIMAMNVVIMSALITPA